MRGRQEKRKESGNTDNGMFREKPASRDNNEKRKVCFLQAAGKGADRKIDPCGITTIAFLEKKT
jgi:hypothetical protein